MAKRNKFVGAFRRHDAGDACGRGRRPSLAFTLATMSSVSASSARGLRQSASGSVAGFSETSTIRASPLAPRWESFFRGARHGRAANPPRWGGGGGAREQRARRRRDVGLPHQAFADQERRDSGLGEPGEIGGAKMPLSPTVTRPPGSICARRSVVASVVSKVFRLRLLMPISRDLSRNARSIPPRRGPRPARPCQTQTPPLRAPRQRRLRPRP